MYIHITLSRPHVSKSIPRNQSQSRVFKSVYTSQSHAHVCIYVSQSRPRVTTSFHINISHTPVSTCIDTCLVSSALTCQLI